MESAQENKGRGKALTISPLLRAIPSLHVRKVAQMVVRVGPPMRITMFKVVATIGRSSRFTDEYAAEMERTLELREKEPSTATEPIFHIDGSSWSESRWDSTRAATWTLGGVASMEASKEARADQTLQKKSQPQDCHMSRRA